jgi:hypothetical protein
MNQKQAQYRGSSMEARHGDTIVWEMLTVKDATTTMSLRKKEVPRNRAPDRVGEISYPAENLENHCAGN